ncbi:MAG: LamG domain-containing protein, partial [Planctomycetales bacterium]
MSRVDRREFIKTSGAAAAAAGAAGLVSRANTALASPASSAALPPHRVQILYGLHAYTDKLSVDPGEEVQFHTTSTVPYKLSVCRLGELVDDPSGDEVLHEFPESKARLQPIHPGSYAYVEKGLQADSPLEEITIECWVRPFLSDEPAGIITQFDLPDHCGFALFLNPSYRITFYLGDGQQHEPDQLHHTPEGTLKRAKWHHVVACWDGKEKSVWVDGERVASWPFSGKVLPGTSPIRLGARGDYGEAFRMLDGDIAMPTIYSRALSEAEIKARFEQKGLQLAKGEDVLACWPLTEENGA